MTYIESNDLQSAIKSNVYIIYKFEDLIHYTLQYSSKGFIGVIYLTYLYIGATSNLCALIWDHISLVPYLVSIPCCQETKDQI